MKRYIMPAHQPTDLQHLSESIASIKRVVRRQVHLPRAIQAIRRLKKKTKYESVDPAPFENEAERFVRLKNTIANIYSQCQRSRLPIKISQIRETVNRRFELEQRSQYQLLLNALKGGGLPLASLSICGQGTREIRYTQLLRYFFDPNELHGLKSKVLLSVLEPEFKRAGLNFKEIELNKANVEAEFHLGNVKTDKRNIGCTVDLFLEFGNYIVLIENKINSSESGTVSSGETSQLKRYSTALKNNFPEFFDKKVLKIYLTPDRRSPKEDTDWLPLAYGEVISRTAKLLSNDSLSIIGRHNLCCFLWDLMTGPLSLDKSSREQLAQLIKDAIDYTEKYIRLKRWCTEYIPLIEYVLQIVEACYVEKNDRSGEVVLEGY
jgi:hypothetical protein